MISRFSISKAFRWDLQVHDCAPTELAGVRCLKQEEVTTSLPVLEENDVIIVDAPSSRQSFFESLRVMDRQELLQNSVVCLVRARPRQVLIL